jgi:hypothetical protein
MDLLKSSTRRSKLSEVAYVVLNVGLALVLLVLALSVQSIWLSIGIVLLSKWRVFAVRPRYWVPNLLANTVDATVGVGHVILLSAASGAIWVQVLQTVGFIVWLLVVKPRSKRLFVSAQALTAMFVGTTALATVLYDTNVLVYVVAMWGLGYVCARHVLLAYNSRLTGLFSLVAAVVAAEVAWLTYQWLFAYSVPGTEDLKLVQAAVIVTLLGFVFDRAVASYEKHDKIDMTELTMPLVFSAGLILTLLIFFNKLGTEVGL